MRKLFSSLLLTAFILTATLVRADTIYLKNGSVLKGKVTSFADDQFIVLLDIGGRSSSRAMIFTGDVTRIEFDSSPSAASEGANSQITSPIREVSRDPQPIEPPPSEKSSRETEPVRTNGSTEREKSSEKSARETSPPESEPKREEETKREEEPKREEPKREVESTPVEKVEKTETPVSDPPAEKPARKPTGLVRTQTVDIVAKRDWTSTGLIVKRGDRITISASGTVTLDQAGERTSGPEGLELSDSRKLMPDHPTGALIAVISSDNDDFIFVGRSTEFVATRDGLLFLSVNEGVLADNTGSYKAVIEIETPRPSR